MAGTRSEAIRALQGAELLGCLQFFDRLQTPEGKRLYAKRKCMPEPVFGIIKSVLGFRQFLLRGLKNVRAAASHPP